MIETHRTVLLAWPYSAPRRLAATVCSELDALKQARRLTLLDASAAPAMPVANAIVVLRGDQSSGPILALYETAPPGGVDGYAALTDALTDAGMSVYVAHSESGDAGAACHYYPPHSTAAVHRETRLVRQGELVVDRYAIVGHAAAGAFEDLPDDQVAEATRTLLAHPQGIPQAVLTFALERGAAAGTAGQIGELRRRTIAAHHRLDEANYSYHAAAAALAAAAVSRFFQQHPRLTALQLTSDHDQQDSGAAQKITVTAVPDDGCTTDETDGLHSLLVDLGVPSETIRSLFVVDDAGAGTLHRHDITALTRSDGPLRF